MIAAAEGEPDQSMTTVAADCPDAGLVFAEEHGSPPDSYAPGCPDREQLRTDLESAQENTAMFEVMEAAVNAGHIHQGQNPCTYPRELRDVIELSDDRCSGAVGETLAEQYPAP